MKFLAFFSVLALLVIHTHAQIEPVKVIKAVSPYYSAAPASAGFQGVIRVRVSIAIDGTVETAELIEGNALLGADAVRAAKKWIFEKRLRDRRSEVLSFRFTLLSDDSPVSDRTSIFLPPFGVEVRTVRPAFSQPSDRKKITKGSPRKKRI